MSMKITKETEYVFFVETRGCVAQIDATIAKLQLPVMIHAQMNDHHMFEISFYRQTIAEKTCIFSSLGEKLIM